MRTIGNILWFLVVCWKMVPLALLPLGSQVVPIDSVDLDPYGVPGLQR
jgi:uncharacterized membrane protein YccF (DUF307 family)